MPSFMRRGSDRINHRRYKLSLDSWYLRVPVIRPAEHEDNILSEDISIYINYCLGYTSTTTGRPLTPRLEIRRQITFWIYQIPSTPVLHHLHILATIHTISYLSKHGSDVYPGLVNVLSEDLPLIRFKKHVMQKFSGPTIVHFVFQRLYRALSTYDPYGKISFVGRE